MDTRQHLVEAWKDDLAVSSQAAKDPESRLDWLHQIYTRIYRFLIASYGTGQWRAARDDARVSADVSPPERRMPFVGCLDTSGLPPRSPDRIRSVFKSIHDSNPGLATVGPMLGIEQDIWVVVDAHKKVLFACAVQRRLVERGFDARLQSRTTDTAVLVRYGEFPEALEVVRSVGRAQRVPIRKRVERSRVNQLSEVCILLISLSMLAALLYLLALALA